MKDFCTNRRFEAPDKTFTNKFSKAKTKFCFTLVYIAMMILVICLLTGQKSIHLKQIKKVSTFQIIFVLQAYLIVSNLTMLKNKKYL